MAEVNLIQGDCLEVLKGLESESYSAVLCDPPYGLKFMGKEWDRGVPSSAVWTEVLRVLKPGAVLLAFGGTRTWHRLAVNIEDAGFELADTLMWLHGQGFPKSLSISKALDKEAGAEGEYGDPKTEAHAGWIKRGRMRGNAGHEGYQRPWMQDADNVDKNARQYIGATDAARTFAGYHTSLKPAWEPCLLFRKPRNATYAQCAVEHGTACLNIGGTRIGTEARTDSAQRQQGPYTSDRTWSVSETPARIEPRTYTGRWPSNLLFSHTADCVQTVAEWACSPECPVRELDRQSGVSKSTGPSNHSRTIGDGNIYHGGKGVRTAGHYDQGGASRFFYCAKSSRRERDEGLSEGMKSPHPTHKPLAITEYLARLIVPPPEYRDDAQLLIPFAGVMSEGIGAVLAGWRNITAIELQEEYCEIGRLRIDWWTAKMEATGLTDPRAILQACGLEAKPQLTTTTPAMRQGTLL